MSLHAHPGLALARARVFVPVVDNFAPYRPADAVPFQDGKAVFASAQAGVSVQDHVVVARFDEAFALARSPVLVQLDRRADLRCRR